MHFPLEQPNVQVSSNLFWQFDCVWNNLFPSQKFWAEQTLLQYACLFIQENSYPDGQDQHEEPQAVDGPQFGFELQ